MLPWHHQGLGDELTVLWKQHAAGDWQDCEEALLPGPHLQVEIDSSICSTAGLMVATMAVLQFPPSESLSSHVIMELR